MQLLTNIKKSLLKINLTLALGLGLAFANIAFAKTHKNLFYGEALGEYGVFSLNYERILSRNMSLRIGAGSFSTVRKKNPNRKYERSGSIVPVMTNYLLGHTNHKFEMGAGLCLVHEREKYFLNFPYNYTEKNFTMLAPILTAGYRYFDYSSGLNFRIGLTGMIEDSIHNMTSFPHISLGLQF